MIQVSHLSKEFAGRVLFKDVTFSINKGEKIGLVGRNGSGKSTIFKILNGELIADSGDISCPKDYNVGVLEQHIKFSYPTVIDECMSTLPEDEKFETYKASKILFGLGFTQEELTKDPLSFSGGFQIRINITKVLLTQPELLLLDEPTNYLDIVSMRWFAQFLKKYPGELILITHDRSFMSEVCTHTMGIHRQSLLKVKGNFESYKSKIEEDEIVFNNTRLNQEKKKKEIEEFVNKFRAKARQAAMAQSRQKMLDKMEDFDALDAIKDLKFSFNYKKFHAKTLVRAQSVSFGYTDSNLFENLSFYINKGDKVAVIGKNGKGKSTLLNCISGELKAKGDFINHQALAIGHFGQTNIQRMSETNSVEQEISSINSDLSLTEVKNICGTMMFAGDDAAKKIKLLSGGEKSRVLLGKILAKESNLLLLDEPTNHLDQESIEALVKEIKSFEGGVVVVTHNEYVLREFANKFIIFNKGKCEVYEGSYDDFLEKIGWEGEEQQSISSKTKLSKKELNIKRQSLVNERSKELKPIRNKISEHERLIEKNEELIEEANTLLIKASEDENSDLIQKYSKQLNQSELAIENSFNLLEELSEQEQKVLSKYEAELENILP